MGRVPERPLGCCRLGDLCRGRSQCLKRSRYTFTTMATIMIIPMTTTTGMATSIAMDTTTISQQDHDHEYGH